MKKVGLKQTISADVNQPSISSEIDTTTQEELVTAEDSQSTVASSIEFTVDHDEEAGTVDFVLSDGTPVQMRSPKAKQFMMLRSWMNTVDEEFRTDEFTAMKLISTCITKFGEKSSVKYDELMDNLEVEDLVRLSKAFEFFRDSLLRLAELANSKGAK